MHGLFVGQYKDGKYISSGGLDGNWEFNASLKNILCKPGYDMYDMNKRIGAVKKIDEFILPFDLKEAPEDMKYMQLWVEDTERFFGLDDIPCKLGTNAIHNLFPRNFEICESNTEIEKIIKEIQEKNNFYIENPTDIDNIIILCDLDGNGTNEKLVVSNVSFDKAFQWEVAGEGEKIFVPYGEWESYSGTFSSIAIIKDNGEYELVDRQVGFDDWGGSNISLAGIYDLDNDGEYEICAAFSGDGAYEGVLDKVNNEWVLVMRSTCYW